ncbi:MAG: ribosome biogenesis GTPase Der [Leptospiraceae bacterium]|nr:ribosome biogenesis GTPase Der [Leptospiraceae bacterium]
MPEIAIIGRQNVGKSTLFNSLVGKRKSIVYDRPGVTRDLISESVPWGEGRWVLTDFPGFEKISVIRNDELTKNAIETAKTQLDRFHLLLWVVTVSGLDAMEQVLAKDLRKMGKPVFLVVNFADDPSRDREAQDIFRLGFENVFFVSALNRRNVPLLKETVITYFTGKSATIENESEPGNKIADSEKKSVPSTEIKIAIIGKPNAGKSTLFNWLLKKEKALTSSIAGTTRDALDEVFPYLDKQIRIVDTAGLRRRRSIDDPVEQFSVQRATEAVETADGIFMLMDPQDGFDKQNRIILDLALQHVKPVVVLVNKFDTIKGDEEYRERMDSQLDRARKLFWSFPSYYITAKDGTRVTKALDTLLELIELNSKMISTPDLNKLLASLKRNPILANHRISPKYITWDSQHQKLILFAGYREVPDNITRFILNEMQKKLNRESLPLKIEIRNKELQRKPG